MANRVLSNIEIIDTIRRRVFSEWLNGKIEDEDLSEWEVFLCNIERHRKK